MLALDSLPLVGVQTPSLWLPPAGVVGNVASLADSITPGVVLDPWQMLGLEMLCARRADGLWAASEGVVVVSRRNGKLIIVIKRALGGLFVFDDLEVRYTAHRDDTALDALTKTWAVVKSHPELYDLCNGEEGLKKSHQEKSITVAATGAKMWFSTRSEGGGRGLDGDVLFVDEALDVSSELLADRLPIILARWNPQVIYFSSAGKRTSVVLHSMRRRALEGDNDGFGYMEFSAQDVRLVDGRVEVSMVEDSRLALARGNPALGYRLSEAKLKIVERGMRLTPGLYDRECKGAFEPLPEDDDPRPVKLDQAGWRAAAVSKDDALRWTSLSARALGFAVDRDGVSGSVSVGVGSLSGECYVETIRFDRGSGWLPPVVVEFMVEWPELAVGCHNAGPTGLVVGAVFELMAEAGIPKERLVLLGAGQYRDACGGFLAAVDEGRLRRCAQDQVALDRAGSDAAERKLTGGFTWLERSWPLSPLESVTVARALLPVKALVQELEVSLW